MNFKKNFGSFYNFLSGVSLFFSKERKYDRGGVRQGDRSGRPN
ncbi:hypothetical protein OIU76_002132 [Salix suchowensis]|nr:hypothetical protein OIU76_002132 [Salix suchowensis]